MLMIYNHYLFVLSSGGGINIKGEIFVKPNGREPSQVWLW